MVSSDSIITAETPTRPLASAAIKSSCFSIGSTGAGVDFAEECDGNEAEFEHPVRKKRAIIKLAGLKNRLRPCLWSMPSNLLKVKAATQRGSPQLCRKAMRER